MESRPPRPRRGDRPSRTGCPAGVRRFGGAFGGAPIRPGSNEPGFTPPRTFVGAPTEAARALNLPLRTLVHKIQTYGIKKKFDR